MDGFAFRWGYHLMALVTAAIWGTTFVSTKVLIQNGLTPAEIFFYRFSLAYVVILLFSRGKLWSRSWRDEGWFALAGIFGGSLYFITENTALGITFIGNYISLQCLSSGLYLAGADRFVIGPVLSLSVEAPDVIRFLIGPARRGLGGV